MLAATAALFMLEGCGWLPDAYSGCNDAEPYQSARQQPPLKAPSGADVPDTRDALKIPEVKAPQLPAQPGTCLEHPPAYGKERPQPPEKKEPEKQEPEKKD
jgi:uncharacterized lipoprotein